MKEPTPSIAVQSERPTKKHVEAVIEKTKKESEEKPIRLNVEIPVSLHKSVKAKAAQDGKTMKEIVLAFLTDYAEK